MNIRSKKPAKRVLRKRSEMTPEEAVQAEKKAAYQRKWKARRKAERAASEKVNKSPELEFAFMAGKAYETKIEVLEAQAFQYRTVIDYLESRIESLIARLIESNRKWQ